ncbi:MAG TPA: hypothetical protein VMS64_32730 [Candidatus Methylomirabilis sp.]|nr:hypothetical protein [Candidatus Methylomirabilis sp.]
MKRSLALVLVVLAMSGMVSVSRVAAGEPWDPRGPVHFVPNSQEFWDFSKNWTTNYGPAYRDTSTAPTNFLQCSSKFALCFHSGAEPLPCRLSEDGRFAKCTCTVMDGINYVLSTAILNYDVYLKTFWKCGDEGQNCTTTNDAPVCNYLDKGKLIPGAQIISTFDTSSTNTVQATIPPTPPLNCDGPFAGCMTAPCTLKKNGQAECSCPVFWGHFQLYGPNAQCDLAGDLVPSASYNPKHDPDVP